jgi:hypothetical protein
MTGSDDETEKGVCADHLVFLPSPVRLLYELRIRNTSGGEDVHDINKLRTLQVVVASEGSEWRLLINKYLLVRS